MDGRGGERKCVRKEGEERKVKQKNTKASIERKQGMEEGNE